MSLTGRTKALVNAIAPAVIGTESLQQMTKETGAVYDLSGGRATY